MTRQHQVFFQQVQNEWITRLNGLPSHQVHHVVSHETGLWLATPSGLTLYDGNRVQVFTRKHGLLTHGLRRVILNGDQLIVCSDLGVDCFDVINHRVTHQLSTAELGIGWCQDAVQFDDDKLMLACAQGLRIWQPESGTVESVGSDIDEDHILNVVQFERERVLIHANNTGLWLYDNGELQKFVDDALFEYGKVTRIIPQHSSVWLITENNILELDRRFYLNRVVKKNDTIKQIQAIFTLSDKKVLLANHSCLIEAKLDKQGNASLKTIAFDVLVNCMIKDTFGNLWVATESNGLLKVSVLHKSIKHFKSASSNSVLSIRPYETHLGDNSDENNIYSMLVSGSRTSYCVLLSSPEKAEKILALDHQECWDLQFQQGTGFWAACLSGLIQFDSLHQQDPAIYDDVRVGRGRCMLLLEKKVLYGTVSGLFIFDTVTKRFKSIVDSDKLTLGYVYTLVRFDERTCYVGTLGRGLWKYDIVNNRLSKIDLKKSLNNIYSLSFNAENELAVVADNHVLLIDRGKVSVLITTNEPVAAWSVNWYSNSELLIGSSSGLKILDVHLKTIVFTIDRFPIGTFWEFTTPRSLFLVASDNLWCGLNDGLRTVNLTEMLHKIPAPIPEVKSLSCNQRYDNTDGKITIKEGSWHFSVSIRCNWLLLESSIRYEFRIVGLANEWRPLEGAAIDFTTLPVGEYILEVRVHNCLTHNDKPYMLLMLEVVSANPLLKSFRLINRTLVNSLSKGKRLKKLISMRDDYIRLEKIVENRTKELLKANSELEKINKKLELYSTKDRSTGLYNLRYLLEIMDDEIKLSMRRPRPICVVIINIDSFTKYNQNYGYLAGEVCIQNISKVLEGVFRRTGEYVARFDNQEFIVLLKNKEKEECEVLAQECLQRVSSLDIVHDYSASGNRVSISIGAICDEPAYSSYGPTWQECRQQFLEKADESLYRAKTKGGNQLVFYHDD